MGLDFLMVSDRVSSRSGIEVYPKFIMTKSKDLMIRGSDFYAIWDEANGIWSTEEQDAIRLIDNELKKYANEKYPAGNCHVKYMWDAESGVIDTWHKYCQRQMRDNYHMLDEQLVWDNDPVNKKDYSSKRLTYPLTEGDISAYDTLMSTLYSPEERKKIEWAIGSIVTGDSKKVQKFLVLYGSAGTGKSTVLNIIQDLFEGYYAVFDAKALGSSGAQFALEAFKNNPLVAIQHDGDLSRIEDNTRLNSLVSHELMTINEKFKSTYTNRFKAFLFMGTNKPVKITDSKSGLLRRLIDVTPTGNKVSMRDYKALMKEIKFELGAIACHCRDVYLSDPGAYDDYKPMSMMGASNDFYNYVLDSYDTFRNQEFVTLKQAWEMYKVYVEEAKVSYPMSQRVFKEELKTYFSDFKDIYEDGDDKHRNVYTGFSLAANKVIAIKTPPEDKKRYSKIKFEVQPSLFDKFCSDCPAQYANAKENPNKKWAEVTTELKDIRTNELHYVKVPKNHIVIDFDIPGDDGSKSYERNLEEASKWPATYAELSKSGKGIHLHYIYDGDVNKLSRIYAEHIEIKVFTGNSALRRRLTKCNDIPIAKISSGLPLKEEKKMINFESVQSAKEIEQSILNLIKRDEKGNVANGHKYTTPNICFIDKILNDAYNSGITYDLERLYNPVLTFAMGSHNQKNKCVQMVNKMHFRSKDIIDGTLENNTKEKDGRLIFVDVEVYPNLFVVCWKYQGDSKVVKMINPKPAEIEELLKYEIVGFNNRKYDNHILYARMMGYNNMQLFELSQNMIQNKKGFIGDAYNASKTDIFDYASKKQSLKKWEIELGKHHQEMGIPWDQPVPIERWEEVADYCCNDVIATEAVFDATQGDWTARQILADLAGMTVNDTTNSLTTRIVFGRERNPQLVYTDLSETFPGYKYVSPLEAEDNVRHNMYRGEDMGFGGYIRSWPGMYTNVALLDIASLHPNSIRAMNCFGEYTKNFTDIIDARIAIKHKDYESAKKMFGGKLAKYLDDEAQAKQLSQALKIAINSVYGLTSASFDNPFRDPRNVNNIVALRGALFMKTLRDEVEARGFKIVAIKTDSIKIADATKDIINFCMEFAKGYGYTFEHEDTYEKMVQINDADYVAFSANDKKWHVTGARFAQPYVFKQLFTHEPITLEDMCETKEVKGQLYLDFDESLPEGEHDYHFVGKIGRFTPIKPGHGGGVLYRYDKDKYSAATGTKGYRWMESELIIATDNKDIIDKSYYENLVNEAIEEISKYGDYEWFVSNDEADLPDLKANEKDLIITDPLPESFNTNN